MGAITSYAIEAAIVLAVEFLVYRLAMAGTTHFRFNRMAIMGCYALALACAPLMGLEALASHSAPTAGAIALGTPTATIAHAVSPNTAWQAVPIVYFAGVAIMAIWTCLSYARLFRLIRSGQRIVRKEYTLIVFDREIAPFSWGRYVVLSRRDQNDSIILAHELAHIRHRHTLDLCLAQLFVIFNWFNPAAYLMRQELNAVQEYEADAYVLAAGVNARQYQLLLIKKTAGAGFQTIANSLNHSQLKKRLTMMLKTKSNSARRLVAAVMLPAAIVASALADIPVVAGVIQNVSAVTYGKVSENLSDAQMLSPVTAVAHTSDASNSEDPEVVPAFKGGEAEIYRILCQYLTYPKDAVKAQAQGTVLISFVVNTDGKISDVKVAQSSGFPSLDAEALRVVNEHLNTGWIPGRTNGVPVACTFTLTVRFRLS